jgi:hypothetical protein
MRHARTEGGSEGEFQRRRSGSSGAELMDVMMLVTTLVLGVVGGLVCAAVGYAAGYVAGSQEDRNCDWCGLVFEEGDIAKNYEDEWTGDRYWIHDACQEDLDRVLHIHQVDESEFATRREERTKAQGGRQSALSRLAAVVSRRGSRQGKEGHRGYQG